MGKRLGMPERLVSILEGESLVNDATSLVLLKTAIAAVAGSFVFWNSAGSFTFSVVAAIVIGYVVGVATVWIRAHLRNPVYDTVISFIVPFVAFIPAEEVHASGVLAVVVTGLYTGHHSSGRFSAMARMNERLNWRTIQFVIENGVFLLMGLELHALVDSVGGTELPLEHVVVIAAALVAALIVTRSLFMLPMLAFMRRSVSRYEERKEDFSRRAELTRRGGGNKEKLRRLRLLEARTQADLEHEREQQLGWRDGAVLSWAGMRGVITLAAAQSIPTSVAFRPQLVLIAFLVAVATLLLHGLTLPILIRRLWPEGADSAAASKELFSLRRDLIEAGNEALDEALAAPPADEKHFAEPPENIVRHVRASVRNALSPLAFAADDAEMMEAVESETPAQAYLRLTHEVLEAQRAALLEERAIGRYSSQSLHTAELALDAYEARLSAADEH
ncbi:MAG: cation:proton antiporter [Leucobacter sp.]